VFKWSGIIKMDLEEVKCEAVGWVHVAKNRVRWQAVLNTVMNLRVP
jgi:hypothetical protein